MLEWIYFKVCPVLYYQHKVGPGENFNFHIFPIVTILQGHHYPMCEMLGVGCDEHIIVNDTEMDHLQRDGMQPHKYSNIYKRSNNLIE